MSENRFFWRFGTENIKKDDSWKSSHHFNFSSKWSHSVPIPLAPSDRSMECSGHGRVVDGKCECEDTFLVRFFFVLFHIYFFHHQILTHRVIDVNYKWEAMDMVSS